MQITLASAMLLLSAAALTNTNLAASGLSAQRACGLLVAAAEQYVQPARKPDGYYCEPHWTSSHYSVFALRATATASSDPKWIGSNLVGWYAVRRSDGAVLEWNMGDEEPGTVVTRLQFYSRQ